MNISILGKFVACSKPYRAILVLFPLVALLSLGSPGCSCEKDNATVARVEKEEISAGDLEAMYNLGNISVGEAGERWIDEQVLAHHARSSDLIDRKRINFMLGQYEQQLMAYLLLDSLLQQRFQVTNDQIEQFYHDHQEEYLFKEDAALVIHLVFQQEELARTALAELTAKANSRDSVLSFYNYDYRLAYRGSLLPELESALFAAQIGSFTGPLTTDFGYHLFFLEHLYRRDDQIPLRFVEKSILYRLYQMQLPLSQTTILDSLREVLHVEVY